MLDIKTSSGRPSTIPKEAVEQLQQKLQDKDGFSSYKEIQHWLKVFWGVSVDYTTVHKLIRYKLKAKLKVPKPVHIKSGESKP